MISIKQRLIREHNRTFKLLMRLLWHLYGKEAPIVLMVHGFKPTRAECKNAFELTRASFERLMRFFMENGWIALTQEELGIMISRHQWQSKCFHLTFDDTYDTVFTEAYPILKRYGIPFTMFVTTDLIDKPGYITMEHLEALAKDPLCSIGGHGLQHVVFRNLSLEEMTMQCVDGRKWLEQQFSVEVKSFAFPYGRVVEVSNRNRKHFREMGYDMAFSALEGTVRSGWYTSRWFMPRVNVSETFVDRFVNGKPLRYKDCEGR